MNKIRSAICKAINEASLSGVYPKYVVLGDDIWHQFALEIEFQTDKYPDTWRGCRYYGVEIIVVEYPHDLLGVVLV